MFPQPSFLSLCFQALPENREVQEAWLRGVLPAVMDSESSVQEKALECLDHVVIAHIKSQGKYRDSDASQKLAWELLGLLCEKCQDLRSVACVLTICE